jgi:cytochrome c-type protein NapC
MEKPTKESGGSEGGQRGIWSRPRSRWLFGIPVGGILLFIAGIVFWGGFNIVLEATNTEKFCTSCHEMREFVFPELKETIHYSNRTGVRASCPDCHVPHPWIYKIKRKIAATNELYHKLRGTVDTREKFEAHRLEMAERVWAVMKSTDSRECRNCHDFTHMDYDQQEKVSARRHKKGFDRGQTCIDCHKGIAHHLPEGYEESETEEP